MYVTNHATTYEISCEIFCIVVESRGSGFSPENDFALFSRELFRAKVRYSSQDTAAQEVASLK